uniref:Uncharacterized protein n=1 Tax=Chromera velia CCMP2878 TaxID=1169474 RepID=A0A0G4H578_9ALVE|mmetsp:Transcript_17214/g.34908  ORF Transcript_17214/g.34908 Transcript_17214/m.34908 type:complete len:115 (-) Transcript_17214:32-376(-)|eukprot:Cvel_24694.t1-p1 / transcript=Cvel_24694.t1 / gene=Cvel_24694 / organism=Chromera_velia_CCMP2878 / gene_product=hypothetical protein / transcript_product=hypothetical protein / location=Cvel_scaffold2706:17314-19127(-) / protein_length=114 / sequence_SO=supercontig / SO=protein_coding / is_pseudo=false
MSGGRKRRSFLSVGGGAFSLGLLVQLMNLQPSACITNWTTNLNLTDYPTTQANSTEPNYGQIAVIENASSRVFGAFSFSHLLGLLLLVLGVSLEPEFQSFWERHRRGGHKESVR